jgi:hypothetical protein
MAIPSEIPALIERLNHELEETDQHAITGINKLRPLMSRFPDNILLIQFFAYFNDILLFVEISRRRIRMNVATISPANVTDQEIQEAGEDLATLLGRIREAKIEVEQIMTRLEALL